MTKLEEQLHNASYEGNYEKVKELVKLRGVDVDAIDKEYGTTSLMYACRERRYIIAKFLLNNGADPTIKDNEGKTAMDHAKEEGHKNIIKLLENHIKNLNPKT